MQRENHSPHDISELTHIHLISHNHWDREWIFTAKYANRWLPTFFENLFTRLEEQLDYRFVLDGQTLIIEDYLKQLHPDEAAARERDIRKFVRRGQLLIGPAYLQPDWSLVSGEALVRNLLIGDRMARRYGSVMKAGWLLDNFGQITQTPQIFQGFDIEGAFVWRGVEMPPDELSTEFWWEAPDGSRVLAVYLLDSYRNAMVLGMAPEIAEERILKHTRTLRRFALTPNVLLMNGYEQVPEPDDLLPLLAEFNGRHAQTYRALQSTPPDYLAAVRAHDTELPVLRGYFYSGRYAPILKGVYSSRSYLNQQNMTCQRELERWAEKFNTMAWAFGFAYPEARFEQAWKTLLLNHTHDDLCGCCIDPIARDMEERFNEVGRMASTMSSESLRAIAQAVDTSRGEETAVLIFNPTSRPRSEVISLSLEVPEEITEFSLRDSQGLILPHQTISRIGDKADFFLWTGKIPAVGYKTVYLVPRAEQPTSAPYVATSPTRRTLENQYLRVQINDDGSLTITDKVNGRVYENMAYFEDGGDSGDTYDYSHPQEDRVLTSLGQEADITLEQAGPLLGRFRVALQLELPEGLTPDRTARSQTTRTLPIVCHVELAAGARHVAVRTLISNTVKDHRLRVMFPTGVDTAVSHAGAPFDVVEFPLEEPLPGPDVPERLRDLMLAGRYTAPVNTRPFQRFLSVVDDERGLSVFSRGLTEYEVLPEQTTIALTLLRSVGWLARPDLLTRIGDVGPHIFTPEAQAIGEQVFDYAIYPHGPDLPSANPSFESDRHFLKFRAVQTNVHRGRLPDTLSFFSWEQESPAGALRLTALKHAEDDDTLIVRFFNRSRQLARGRLHIGDPTHARLLHAWRTNLNEEILAHLPLEDGLVPFTARPGEIVTIKVRLDLQPLIEDFERHRARVVSQEAAQNYLPRVELPPVVTPQEAEAERLRAERLRASLDSVREEIAVLERYIAERARPDTLQKALLQELKGREATLARQHYEARISALLNQQLLVTRQMEAQLDEIGESLNWARVHKRVGEFLIHYYEDLLEQENGDGAD